MVSFQWASPICGEWKECKKFKMKICLKQGSKQRHLALQPVILDLSAIFDRYLPVLSTLTRSSHINKINT